MKCENCGSPAPEGLAYCEDIEDCFASLKADVEFLQGKLKNERERLAGILSSQAQHYTQCGAHERASWAESLILDLKLRG